MFSQPVKLPNSSMCVPTISAYMVTKWLTVSPKLLPTQFYRFLFKYLGSILSQYYVKTLPVSGQTTRITCLPTLQLNIKLLSPSSLTKKLGLTTLIYQGLLLSISTDFGLAIIFFLITHINLA